MGITSVTVPTKVRLAHRVTGNLAILPRVYVQFTGWLVSKSVPGPQGVVEIDPDNVLVPGKCNGMSEGYLTYRTLSDVDRNGSPV